MLGRRFFNWEQAARSCAQSALASGWASCSARVSHPKAMSTVKKRDPDRLPACSKSAPIDRLSFRLEEHLRVAFLLSPTRILFDEEKATPKTWRSGAVAMADLLARTFPMHLALDFSANAWDVFADSKTP